MQKMEVDEEPRDSIDPVGNALPAPDPESELKKAPTAEEDAPPNPDGGCCPIDMSPEGRAGFGSPDGEITRPYQRYLGKTSMRTSDWTYYQEQDEADPTEYHPSWPTGMRELGPVWIPAGSESQRRIPPLSPTYRERTLWSKIADLKQQKS